LQTSNTERLNLPQSSVLRPQSFVLAVASVVCLAAASVFVRWAAPVSSGEIAFWRLAIAALAVLGVAGLRRQLPRYQRADLPILAGIGLVTALHFLAYIAALAYTTVAHTLALVYTAPLFVAGLAAWRLDERLNGRQWLGLAIAVAGVAVLTGFEATMSPAMLLGDGLALVSAATFGIYSVAGRGLRGRYPLLAYTPAIYGAAALWLLPVAAIQFEPAHYTPATILAVVALGLVPLGLGHTLYNAALRYLPAATVNTIATQEVTGGVLLAWLLLGEAPTPTTLLGAAVTLAGVLLVLRAVRAG
jgi:drug/metabolite transporter (DMT)-like permease